MSPPGVHSSSELKGQIQTQVTLMQGAAHLARADQPQEQQHCRPPQRSQKEYQTWRSEAKRTVVVKLCGAKRSRPPTCWDLGQGQESLGWGAALSTSTSNHSPDQVAIQDGLFSHASCPCQEAETGLA